MAQSNIKTNTNITSRFFANSSLGSRIGGFIKRAFDIVAALIGLILLSPIFALIAILIKRDTPGPVFFRGLRMGRKGRPFKMLKFRTMYERPESYRGARVTSKDDDRITEFGRWLRDTKINELPQLWNVLIGNMSLVGPRPEDVEITKTWPTGAYREILSVRPGVTSPASILYHDEEKLLSGSNVMGEYFKSILPDKMRLDRLYVRHHSFFSDIDVIFWTLAILLPRLANTRIPEGYLFAGPFSRLIHRYVSWFVLDLGIAFVAASLAGILWRIESPSDWGFFPYLILAIGLAIIFSGGNYLLGLNRIMWSHATWEDGLGLFVSSFVSMAGILTANYLQNFFGWLPYPSLPVDMLVTTGLFAQLGFVAARFRLRLLAMIANRWLAWRGNSSAVRERVLIVGNGEGSQIASWLLERRMFRNAFSIVGMVDDADPTRQGLRINGCWMLGGINDIPSLIPRLDVGVLLLTIPNLTPELDDLIFNLSRSAKVRLIFLNDLLWLVDRQITRPTGSFDHPKWLDERLDFRAVHDTVTEIPNRRILQEHLRHSVAFDKRYHTKHAVIFVELKNLSNVIEMFGDCYSNEVLKEVSRRLMCSKRESDTLARFEENGFALIMENVPDERETRIIENRIRDKLEMPFFVHGHELNINSRLGVSLCTGACQTSGESPSVNVGLCYECVMRPTLEKVLSQNENVSKT